MYYLDKDGNKIIEENYNGIAVAKIKICPSNCKCMKCFFKNKMPNYSYNNIIITILFLILMYFIFHLILRMCM